MNDSSIKEEFMEFKNICSKACFLFISFCLSLAAMSQVSEKEDKNLLLGKWLFQDASISDLTDPIYFDLDNDYYKLYAEIEVKEDMVLLKDSELTRKVKYEVDGEFIGIYLPLGEFFIAEWAILDNKLYLEFDSFHPYDASKKVKVLLVYKRG